jgi:exopolyphosphatase/guanosine-5'-triphosphate,3'-diphosphate pyrophosphatase
LAPTYQRRVRQLSGLLRVAEGLDRSHFQNVVALRARLTGEALHIFLATKGDPQLEVWAAQEQGALFETAFDRSIHVEPTEIPAYTNGEVVPASTEAARTGRG